MSTRRTSRHTEIARRLALCAGLLVGTLAGLQVTAASQSSHSLESTVIVVRRPVVVRPLSARGATGAASVRFRLPQGTSQGGGDWYALDARIRIQVRAHAGTLANEEIAAATNGFDVGVIDMKRTTLGGLPGLIWSSQDLFSGTASGIVVGSVAVLHVANYLQVRGARGGRNALSLSMSSVGKPLLSSATLLPGSRIIRLALRPAHLRLHLEVNHLLEVEGQSRCTRYELESVGMPARDVGIAVSANSPALTLVGAPSQFFAWVLRREGELCFRAASPGTYEPQVIIAGQTGGSIVATLIVRVEGIAHDRRDSRIKKLPERTVTVQP